MSLTPEQVIALQNMPLGDAANRLRLAFALTGKRQKDLSDATGIAPSNLSDIVNGKYSTLTVDTASKIAEFFRCAIEDLFPRRAA
jgi:DNA-binding Xre family transcriptional regulator